MFMTHCPICNGNLMEKRQYSYFNYQYIGKRGRPVTTGQFKSFISKSEKCGLICENADWETDSDLNIIKPEGSPHKVVKMKGKYYFI